MMVSMQLINPMLTRQLLIDSNGDIYVNGGTIDVTGNSTFDYDGTAEFNCGTIIVNGIQVDTIPNQMIGGGNKGGNRGGKGF